MAQGWAKKLKSDCIEAFSAGVYPVAVNSKTIEIMAEAGVDISQHRSKHVDQLAGIDFDYVITLCDNAREICPVFHGKAKLIHKPFSDPSMLIGSQEVMTAAFRKVRDQIRDFILTLPDSLAKEKNDERKK